VQVFEKFEKLGIFFVDAKNFIRVPNLRLREPDGPVMAAKPGHSPESGTPCGQRLPRPKRFKRRWTTSLDIAVFQALGFFVRARPFQSDDIREQLSASR